MIYRYLLAALCFCAPVGALAQLRVELEFEQETYLPNEPMYAIVKVLNTSGQTLTLGNDNEWLSFTVEPAQGGIVKQKKPIDVEGPFTLPTASRARKMVNLAEFFELTKFGRYNVSATVLIKEWDQAFSIPKRKPVGIATGVKLWETAFGLPSEQKNGRPEVRKFQLMQANHLKQLSLYVRITDESEAETYSLFPLGKLVGFSRPEPQLDLRSNLHVFYQDSAHSFRYFQITPDGLLLARQTWEIGESRPIMTLNAEGRISVTGGVRRISGTDLPPPELRREKAEASAPVPLEADTRRDAEKAVN